MNSTFTLTFAIEILCNDSDVIKDCDNTEWIDLEPYKQGLKIQYNLYPGRVFDLDILMWHNVGKIWCENQHGWVRVWRFLDRFWMVFSIRHKIPVKVKEFINHEVVITPNFGTTALSSIAKSDKSFRILIPPLKLNEHRYFASVVEKQYNVGKEIVELIWNKVLVFIPASYFDGVFDTPQPVSDVRHQDAIICYIKDTILSSNNEIIKNENNDTKTELTHFKEKEKKTIMESVTYRLKLSGTEILAGAGRINRFKPVGECAINQGRILAIISSWNVPSQIDVPIVFVNINKLTAIPMDELQKFGLSQVYTRCKISTEVHESKPQSIISNNNVQFDDHHVMLLEGSSVLEVLNNFSDNCFQIQLRGVKEVKKLENSPSLFTDTVDVCLHKSIGNTVEEEQDVLIACTRIDVKDLSKGMNRLIFGEFPLYPPQSSLINLKCENICTNYINAVSAFESTIYFQPYKILQSHMMLEVSLGLLGCEPYVSNEYFTRLYCFIKNKQEALIITENILRYNEIAHRTKMENLLCGFSLDTGDIILIFIEGLKNNISKIWELTENLQSVKTVYSSSVRYILRIYPEMVNSLSPFDILKMRVPLSSLLACPLVYVRPALPIPTRKAILKINHIINRKFFKAPSRCEMPTEAEIRSLKLELCTPLCSSTRNSR